MCAIIGVLSYRSPVSPVVLRRMADAVAHRGLDGEGAFIDGPIGLAHRRLAILDLSPAGHQPMVTADGRYVLSYNGEVYNYQELRLELEALGHQFRSRTDSEVVLHAWAEWGEKSLLRFNGMFAFALWDSRRRELVLARDRYGVKPLYYAHGPDAVLFGSEVKAILAHPAFSAEMDREALLEYMTFQNFFTHRTLFKGIRLLPAGSVLRLTAEPGNAAAPARYWDYRFMEPKEQVAEQDFIDEFGRLFRQAVSRQLHADVPVSSYLSGGMDSGSITAVAASQVPYIKTFTVGFDLSSASGIEMGCDERVRAEAMSYHFKTEHYEMVLKAGDMERCLAKLMWHLEEPRVGQSYPNFYAAKLASRFGKVVLSGAGGDELFAGYPWRYYRAVVNDGFDHYIDKYYAYWQRLIPNTTIRKIFAPIWNDVRKVWTRDIFRDVFAQHCAELTRPEDYINHSLYFEAKTFLHGLLVVEDKLSMAHGLETRVPFLDNDLVDFAMGVPTRLKLGHLVEVVRLNENEPGDKTKKYFAKTRDGKLLLRKAMRRFIPVEIAEAEKQGFSAPDASWFRGDSIDYVQRRLCHDDARIYHFLDGHALRALVDEHIQGKQNRRLLIWSLLCLEEWCRLFLEGDRREIDHGLV